MENFFSENQLFIVLSIALVIWASIGIIMVNTENKLNKIEKLLKNKDQ